MNHKTCEHEDGERSRKRRRIDQAEREGTSHAPPQHPSCTSQELARHHGHFIDNIVVRDTAGAHLGDNNITNHYYAPVQAQAQPQPGLYEILLDSLTFDRMDARARNVAAALPKTCDCLPHHEKFLAWINGSVDSHHGFLWIKGKPGSGKSTIMKETLTWARQHWPHTLVLSYFFNARSPHRLEKSSLGLYRSLLHQLLCLLPDVRALFTATFASKKTKDGVEEWKVIELQNYFIHLIKTLQGQPVTIFIDALDEGADDDVRQMVKFLERLTQHAVIAASSLRICLASRHYPHINAINSLSLVVEDQTEHSRDIQTYIYDQLPDDSLEMDDLRYKVQEQSSGIFLWVVLVTMILNKSLDRGQSVATVLRKLHGLPPDLHNLFNEILLRDSEDLDECITLFQWVLFSQRDLSPIELYHAVQYTHLKVGDEEPLIVTLDVAIGYLRNCSRGLVELTKADDPAVQFIHETVRDYLKGGNVLNQEGSGPPLSQLSDQDFCMDNCNEKLSGICLKYLLWTCRKNPSAKEVYCQYPLASYAAESWWLHFQSTPRPCSRRVLNMALDLLTGSPDSLLLWVQLYDIDFDERYEDDKNSHDDSISADDLASPLYYATCIGRKELISGVLALGADVNAEVGSERTALNAAVLNENEQIVQMLLDWGADVNARVDQYCGALTIASEHGHENIVRMLLQAGADVNAQGEHWYTALLAASRKGYLNIVQMLLERGADVNTVSKSYHFATALEVASERGHENIVQILIDAGADVNAQGLPWRSALQVASRNGHEKIVQMLLERGAK